MLNNLLHERNCIRGTLRARNDVLAEANDLKSAKLNKLVEINRCKSATLKTMEEQVNKNIQIDIPETLAEELHQKITDYENKLAYEKA